jgi:hypothetical protein
MNTLENKDNDMILDDPCDDCTAIDMTALTGWTAIKQDLNTADTKITQSQLNTKKIKLFVN